MILNVVLEQAVVLVVPHVPWKYGLKHQLDKSLDLSDNRKYFISLLFG